MRFEVPSRTLKIFYMSINFWDHFYSFIFFEPFTIYSFDYRLTKKFFSNLWDFHRLLVILLLNIEFDIILKNL
jgi:hypothetical protein